MWYQFFGAIWAFDKNVKDSNKAVNKIDFMCNDLARKSIPIYSYFKPTLRMGARGNCNLAVWTTHCTTGIRPITLIYKQIE